MDLSYLFHIFRTRLAWIAACGLAFGAIGLAAGMLMHRHAATATLLVTSPIVDTEATRRGGPPPGPAASAVEVLSSPRVLRRVIEAVHLTPDHPHAAKWGNPAQAGMSPDDWMAAHLLKDVRFTASPDSNIVAVTAYSSDRQFAVELADAFVDTYQQISREVQTEQARWRATQLEHGLARIEEELQGARARMAQFRRDHPGFDPDERNNASGGTVAALSAQLVHAESERTAAETDPALQSLQADARRARARWQEVSERYGVNHPAYAEANAELQRAEGALAAAAAATSRANAQRAATLRAALKAEQAQSVSQTALHEEYSSFQRALVAAETAANNTRGQLRQARLERDTAAGSASVWGAAVPLPPGASDPWRRALPLGMALGLVLGSLAALLAEEWSPRVRRWRNSGTALGARLLTHMPDAARRQRAWQALLGHEQPTPSRPAQPHDPERELALGRILVPDGTATAKAPRQLAYSRPPRAMRADARPDPAQPSPTFIVDLHPAHPVAEAVRGLRAEILIEWRQGGRRRPVCVQSLEGGDGRTFLACNLAIAFAQANLRTVLVDLDLRAPSLHSLFGLQPGTGVAGLLAGNDGAPQRRVDSRGYLDVIPAGPPVPNPQELVSSAALSRLLLELNERYDAVVLDGPAWNRGADAQLLAAAGADVVLLARSDRTPLRPLQAVRERLEQLQARVLGVVTNAH